MARPGPSSGRDRKLRRAIEGNQQILPVCLHVAWGPSPNSRSARVKASATGRCGATRASSESASSKVIHTCMEQGYLKMHFPPQCGLRFAAPCTVSDPVRLRPCPALTSIVYANHPLQSKCLCNVCIPILIQHTGGGGGGTHQERVSNAPRDLPHPVHVLWPRREEHRGPAA
jgi:hypothetical protein